VSYATIDALRESLAQPERRIGTTEYAAKMLHAVPKSTSVDRAKFIVERVTGKRVLEFGASGPMHEAIVKAAARVLGVDREDSDGVVGFDLDAVLLGEPGFTQFQRALPEPEFIPDVILCGEVIEHLANPGWFLKRLKAQFPGVPVLITVPNAFCIMGFKRHLEQGVENVNIDHVAWYSHRTMKTLLARYGYGIEEFFWYGGDPYTAEGLIMVAR
jgi:hypothetical protein